MNILAIRHIDLWTYLLSIEEEGLTFEARGRMGKWIRLDVSADDHDYDCAMKEFSKRVDDEAGDAIELYDGDEQLRLRRQHFIITKLLAFNMCKPEAVTALADEMGYEMRWQDPDWGDYG